MGANDDLNINYEVKCQILTKSYSNFRKKIH